MAAIGKQTVDGQVIWYDQMAFARFEPCLFDPTWLHAQGLLTGTSTGRNEAWFLTHDGTEMVLRHYYRGGMIGRLIKDRFLRQPIARSRAMLEFVLLDWMRDQGLPVPRPLAARFTPAGPWYRADLLMERLPGTRTLAEILRDMPLENGIWAQVGDVIARLHLADVFHSDLNCRNILVDQAGKVWLIDFDKCDRRPKGDWSIANLDRLHRSFVKEKNKVPALNWDEDCWSVLKAGYQARMSANLTEG